MSELIDPRDNKGRFGKGNKASLGRPPGAKKTDLLRRMREIVRDEDWDKIVKTAVRSAISGDAKAREWLTSYLIGKPTDTANIVQVNQYAPVGTTGENALFVLAQLLATVSEQLPEGQRDEFDNRLASLTRFLAPPQEEAYHVDEHGVVRFDRD